MLVPYFEIMRSGCLTCCYSPHVYDVEFARLNFEYDEIEITQYIYDTATQFVRIYVWDVLTEDWIEVGGAPLVKMGASLVKSIEFAHATARLHDYWL